MLTNQTNSGKSQRLINEITDANETYRNLSNKTIENAIHSFKYGLEGSSGSITSKETQSTKTRIELLQMQLLGYEIFK